jgi:hypothetical protein
MTGNGCRWIALTTALVITPFSTLAGPLDAYCDVLGIELCPNGSVSTDVCRADPRDCIKPTLYRANPGDPRARSDPYFVGQYSVAAREYLVARVGYLTEVYRYGSAAKCKVVGPDDASFMASMDMRSTFDYADPTTPSGSIALADERKLAADTGVALRNGAEDDTTCEYWRSNPDAVEQMRQLDREALGVQ